MKEKDKMYFSKNLSIGLMIYKFKKVINTLMKV
jgi:hypothetical protein